MNKLYPLRWFIFSFFGLALIYLGPFIRKATQPDNDIAIWFSKNDPTLIKYKQFQQEFGNDRVIILAFEKADGILEKEALSIIYKITNSLEQIPMIRQVESITNIRDFKRVNQLENVTIRFEKILNTYREGSSIPDILKSHLSSSPFVANRLINKNATATQIIIRLSSTADPDQAIQQIHATASAHLGSNYFLNGIDVIVNYLNAQSEHDFSLFSSISYLIMFIGVGLMTRNWRHLFLVLISASATLIYSLAVYGWLGFHLNVFTVMTPPLLIILSIINSLHVINAYTSCETSDVRLWVTTSTLQILKPFTFALLTTSCGFLSLLSSEARVLQEFGIFGAVGSCFGYVFPVLAASFVLPSKNHLVSSTTNNYAVFYVEKVLQHPFKFGIVLTIILVVSVVGLVQVKNDMYPIEYFQKNHPVQQANEFMTRHWGNYFPLDLALEVNDSSQFSQVDVARAVNKFELEVKKDSTVGYALSYVTILNRYCEIAFGKPLNQILANPFIAGKLTSKLTQIIRDSTSLLNNDLTQARFLLTGKSMGNQELEERLREIQDIGARYLGHHSTLTLIGYQALFIKAMNLAFDTMMSSLVWSFILIAGIIWIMLRDHRLAIIAIIPNVFPIIVLLGFMGWMNINLDLATCTVSAIFLGIAVDDTIHILYRYKHFRLDHSKNDALIKSFQELGQVFIRTGLILVIGFSVLLAANLKTIVYLGELAMVASVSAFIGDLILMPLLIKVFHR